MNWFTKLYAWACERLYYEFAGSYDWVSWLISLGHWSSWRRVALDYLPASFPSSRSPLEKQSEEKGEASSLRVLEIGFGTGELLLEMARRGIDVYGLELSPAMHQITRMKLGQRGLAVPRVRALAQAMPLAADSFDGIVSTFPAPYILDAATLCECARLLRKPEPDVNRPGGRLVIVGLWVEIEHSFLRRLAPLFYGAPSPAFLAVCQARLTAAGLDPTVTLHHVGPVRLSVIVAQRSHNG